MSDDDVEQTFDPIALTLAVWLGLIVSVSSISRMAHDAAARHEAETAARPPTTTTLTGPLPVHPVMDPGA